MTLEISDAGATATFAPYSVVIPALDTLVDIAVIPCPNQPRNVSTAQVDVRCVGDEIRISYFEDGDLVTPVILNTSPINDFCATRETVFYRYDFV